MRFIKLTKFDFFLLNVFYFNFKNKIKCKTETCAIIGRSLLPEDSSVCLFLKNNFYSSFSFRDILILDLL